MRNQDSILWVNPPCPLLPGHFPGEPPLRPSMLLALGKERGGIFYRMATHIAQTQWRRGLPAQALLQLNRAMSADFHDAKPLLEQFPIPYHAVAWIIQHCPENQFLGNPRRHYQHLATRMSGPRREIRSWRAWACWELACHLLDPVAFPPDTKQLQEESLVEPNMEQIEQALRDLGEAGEVEHWVATRCTLIGLAQRTHQLSPV